MKRGEPCFSCKFTKQVFSALLEAFPSRLTLSAIPSHVVTAGENVTLQCVSQAPYNMSILMKDGEKFSSPMVFQKIHSDLFRALFSVGPVTPNERWTFTCYGYSLSRPQLWSVPSGQLELLVSGKEVQYVLLSIIATDTGSLENT